MTQDNTKDPVRVLRPTRYEFSYRNDFNDRYGADRDEDRDGKYVLLEEVQCAINYWNERAAIPHSEQRETVAAGGISASDRQAIDGFDQVMQERDHYHEIADKLAEQIAAITATDIGEHSSANCPWDNALQACADYWEMEINALAAPVAAPVPGISAKAEAALQALADQGQELGLYDEAPVPEANINPYVVQVADAEAEQAHPQCVKVGGHCNCNPHERSKCPSRPPVPEAKADKLAEAFAIATAGPQPSAPPTTALADLWMHEDMARNATAAVADLPRKELQAHYMQARDDLAKWKRRALEAEAKAEILMDRQYLAGFDAGFMAGEAGDHEKRTAVHTSRDASIREAKAEQVARRDLAADWDSMQKLIARGYTVVGRLYNKTPNLSDSVEAGDVIQSLTNYVVAILHPHNRAPAVKHEASELPPLPKPVGYVDKNCAIYRNSQGLSVILVTEDDAQLEELKGFVTDIPVFIAEDMHTYVLADRARSNAAWAEYLREGETPLDRLKREIKDSDTLATLLAHTRQSSPSIAVPCRYPNCGCTSRATCNKNYEPTVKTIAVHGSIGDDAEFMARVRHWAAAREFHADDNAPHVRECLLKLVAYIDARSPVAAAPDTNFLLPSDLAALQRFHECAMDFDSGGHDVSKEAMARLREIGVVENKGFGRHQVTSFGDYVLGRAAGADFKFPLKTYAEYNEESRLATAASSGEKGA